MRVLVVSRFLAEPTHRAKLTALAERPGVEVFALAPAHWREGGRVHVCRAGEEGGFRLFAGKIALSGRVGGHFYRAGLRRALRAARPHIVHLEEQSYGLAAAQALVCASRMRERPRVLVTCSENAQAALPLRARMVERFVFRRADALLVYAASARERLARAGAPLEKVRALPQWGVDPGLFRPPAGGARAFLAGYAGRLVEAKGVDVFLKALARLPGEWRAQIVGEGSARQALERLAHSLGIAPRVEFVGGVERARMPGYMRGWRALVLPSRETPRWREQFGRVLIEAMACGAVPVGAATGEIPRTIGAEGWVFPENDHAALARILTGLGDDPARCRRLAEAGRKRVLATFAWEVVAEKIHRLYREILGE